MTAPMRYIIVVGVDYSNVSRLALREGLNIGLERASCEVHVVHVDPDFTEAAPQSPTTPTAVEAVQRLYELVDEEVTAFRTILRPFDAKGMRVVLHVRTDAPGKGIAQLAADLQADLVVVGTHGLTGLTRVLLGSVAHAVVTLAPCPVLVVRAKQTPKVPDIEPACPRCLEARKESGGRELWCEQHRQHGGRSHTFYQDDRVGQETNFPLVFEQT
jgi:nucleotide-binding universal stress UspA family protein